ncbi:hypothetical protein LUZ61_006418 [Rhynchospora tenuis]|uniref:Uncharacterized protein n=1 Tax=Rhynchospora tenuis TaxID=198213 RepID=A0AAD5ZRK7_9POAL|nr:hypothetical protein LUZ61_006418 [Rhynchospora tenuis]
MKRKSATEKMRKGPWSPEEDTILLEHVRNNGARNWSLVSFLGLLPRTGKSCRLRWVNKLRPGLKKGRKFTPEEEQKVLDLQAQFGNKWATIAKYFPGRTDNDVKNYWSIHCKRLARARHDQRGPLIGISDQVANLKTNAVSVASPEEFLASEEQEAVQGSNSKGNSDSGTSSTILDPQPDLNPILHNPVQNLPPQPAPFDPIFDLPPLPEICYLQPKPRSVNLSQDRHRQSTRFFEGEPEVGSMDLGQTQLTNPNHHCLNYEDGLLDSGLDEFMDSVPSVLPPPEEFDDLSDILDSFEPPVLKSPH